MEDLKKIGNWILNIILYITFVSFWLWVGRQNGGEEPSLFYMIFFFSTSYIGGIFVVIYLRKLF